MLAEELQESYAVCTDPVANYLCRDGTGHLNEGLVNELYKTGLSPALGGKGDLIWVATSGSSIAGIAIGHDHPWDV